MKLKLRLRSGWMGGSAKRNLARWRLIVEDLLTGEREGGKRKGNRETGKTVMRARRRRCVGGGDSGREYQEQKMAREIVLCMKHKAQENI